ncbi:MAG: rhodanese-like domain-containing protein [Gammaproteobacteria bacterium]|nr:rhodanese-like domain-containing protein [Gammaproteobacteria bacterium]
MRHFSAIQLAEYLKHQQPLLLDVREPWEFAICKLDDSQLVPMRQVPEYSQALNPHQEIVVICHHGIRSKAICQYLEQQFGFDRLINLEGGVDAWAKQVDPTMAVY